MRIKTKITILIAAVFPVLFFSCSPEKSRPEDFRKPNSSNDESAVFRADTDNVSLTLEMVKLIQPASKADSTYRHFIDGLVKANEFNAALEHLKSYRMFFNHSPAQQAYDYMRTGESYSALAQYDSAIQYFSNALTINLEIKDSAAAAVCEHNIGYNLQFNADFTRSLEHIYNALKYYERQKDTANICLAYYDIAEGYYQLGDFEKTHNIYRQCFDYYTSKSDTFKMAELLVAMSDVENKLKRTEDALKNCDRALVLWKYLGDVEGEANCLNTKAAIYKDLGKWDEAINYYKESYSLVINTEFRRPIPVLSMNLGVAYMHTGNLDDSEKYLLAAIDEFKKAELYNYLLSAFKQTGVLYTKKRMFDRALEYTLLYDSLDNIIQTKKSAEAIAALNLKYESEKSQNKILELSKEKLEIFTKARMFFLLSIIAVLLIIFMILRNKNRRKQLDAEKALKELELSKARLKHEYDKKLMDDFAQRILDKNKLITDLERKIKSAPGFNSSTETAKKNLEELSKLKILTGDDWDKFQMNYNKVFPGSIKSIVTTFSELTESELRMFLLIKLNIRIREVASVLGISQESVRKTRYRMRKKLNIGEDTDLDEFVKNFSAADDTQMKAV